MHDLATDFDMAARGSSKVMLASAFVPARLHGLFFPSPPIHILTEYPFTFAPVHVADQQYSIDMDYFVSDDRCCIGSIYHGAAALRHL